VGATAMKVRAATCSRKLGSSPLEFQKTLRTACLGMPSHLVNLVERHAQGKMGMLLIPRANWNMALSIGKTYPT